MIGAEAGEIGLWLWTEAEAGEGAGEVPGEVGETGALALFVLAPRWVLGLWTETETEFVVLLWS